MTQLALVIDLNVCVGCHACVTSCKEWNTSGPAGFMSDDNPYSKEPTGTFFNQICPIHNFRSGISAFGENLDPVSDKCNHWIMFSIS